MSRFIILISKYRALLPYIVAQARHESYDFKSTVYLLNRNMFGIKFINSPKQLNAVRGLKSPERNFYAHFRSENDSVIDLLRIFEAKKMPTSVTGGDQYASELQKRGYLTAGLSEYSARIIYYLNA